MSAQESQIYFTEKIFVHNHFLRIMSIEMRFCGLTMLTWAYEFIFVGIILRPSWGCIHCWATAKREKIFKVCEHVKNETFFSRVFLKH